MRGSIRQRSKGTWQVRFDAPRQGPGQREYASVTVRGTKKDAERVLREKLTALEQGNFVTRQTESVSQFFGRWMADYAATNTTVRTQVGYQGYIDRYITPVIGVVPLQSLTTRQIQGMYASLLKNGKSPRTVRQLHVILREALAHAVKWGLLARNPADATTRPRVEREELEMWDLPTIRRFLSIATGSRFEHVYRFAILTGMRRSELVGLRWEQVDLARGTVQVTRVLHRIAGQGLVSAPPKTARSRRLVDLGPVTVQLLHVVHDQQEELKLRAGDLWQETGHVFTHEDGSPIPGDKPTKEFAGIVKKHGLPHLTFHGLRHAHATLMLSAGVNPKVTSERLGHSSIAMTMDIYSHVLPGLQKDAAKLVEEQLGGE